MPELPEVEFARRQVAAWFGGHRVDEIVLHDERLLAHGATARLIGQRVNAVERRGKFLLVRLEEHTLVLHFKMTGKVVPQDGRRARMTVSIGGGLYDFVDTRRLGKAWVVEHDALDDATVVGVLARLGPEPWPVPLEAGVLHAQLGGTRRAIKVALLDQEVVAGVGNIIAAESLWRAGLNPASRAGDLTQAQLGTLCDAICAVCESVLAVEVGEEIAYLNDPGRGEAPNPFFVYQRDACTSCGAAIERLTQAGRTTYWCPTCQGGRR